MVWNEECYYWNAENTDTHVEFCKLRKLNYTDSSAFPAVSMVRNRISVPGQSSVVGLAVQNRHCASSAEERSPRAFSGRTRSSTMGRRLDIFLIYLDHRV